jgi:hypothetical protein
LLRVPYDWGTKWPGVFERHADRCPFRYGETCTCGPLGYVAATPGPITGELVRSPLLETLEEARTWRRDQDLAGSSQHQGSPGSNGAGHPARTQVLRGESTQAFDVHDEIAPAPLEYEPPPPLDYEPEPPIDYEPPARPAAPTRPPSRRAPRRAPGRGDISVSALIDRFLDAAEDGEARGKDGRPFSEDELAELEWALSGYVARQLGTVSAGAVRGAHVFQLIDDLEDAGMPRSRLRSVVGALRELFDYAADLDLVRVNPATYVSLPSDDRRPRKRLVETLESRKSPADAQHDGHGFGESLVSERTIWMLVKIVALIFICIALVLVAESV